MRFLLIPVLALMLPAMAAAAQTLPKLHQTIKDWAVFTVASGGDTICYVRSHARDMAPKNVNHGDVTFFISNWKSGSGHHQPSLMVGYDIKASPPPKARIGHVRITMYPDGNEAFIEEAADEKKLVSAMRKGSALRVEARSMRGTATAYEFSMAGVTAALKKADALCK